MCGCEGGCVGHRCDFGYVPTRWERLKDAVRGLSWRFQSAISRRLARNASLSVVLAEMGYTRRQILAMTQAALENER